MNSNNNGDELKMAKKNWFQEQYEKLENDPGYIAAGLMIEINEKFSIRMEELGMSQRALAKKIGKSQPYVSKMLNRGTNMTLETMAMFAVALDLDIKAPEFAPRLSAGKFCLVNPRSHAATDWRDISMSDWEKDESLISEERDQDDISDAA